jgi:hypothetical protein
VSKHSPGNEKQGAISDTKHVSILKNLILKIAHA